MDKHYREIGHIEKRTFLGDTKYPLKTVSVELATGQELKKGAVLGYDVANKNYKLVDSKNANIKAICILATEDINTDEETIGIVYVSGDFNYDALYVAEGDKVLNHLDDLKLGNIYVNMEVANY